MELPSVWDAVTRVLFRSLGMQCHVKTQYSRSKLLFLDLTCGSFVWARDLSTCQLYLIFSIFCFCLLKWSKASGQKKFQALSQNGVAYDL